METNSDHTSEDANFGINLMLEARSERWKNAHQLMVSLILMVCCVNLEKKAWGTRGFLKTLSLGITKVQQLLYPMLQLLNVLESALVIFEVLLSIIHRIWDWLWLARTQL